MNLSESNAYFPTSTSAMVYSHNNMNYTLVKDMREWLFNRKRHNDTPNLTVLPVLAILGFIVCVLLKVYKWYKDGVRLKNRGDVEFGDESEVNYGIIRAGDKNFCNVEIRSDTTSVYDTVTSYRYMGNGYAVGGGSAAGGNYNYHDTVTSYRSLLMQRLDGAQYDSVKSYKAFLRQVTQNTDLAVDVKLLENYPKRSKSAEHCVLEEESSGISEAMKPLSIADVKVTVECKKKGRHRKASGDVIGAMRKRSCSNPTYNSSRTGAASLPSIRQTLSSDSSNDDDTFVTLASDRRKLWEHRKKMARSCSGSKIAKGDVASDIPHFTTRRRHFSADSARRPRKPLGSLCHRADLVDLRESISETDPRPDEVMLLKKPEESSSDNPDSSPTSCSTSVSSDAIESESEDDETQQITQVSAASDDHTMSCDGVFDSCGELNSSAEHLLGPNGHLNESMNGICNLPLELVEQRGEVSVNLSPVPVTPLPTSISPGSTIQKDHREEAPGEISASVANKKENHSTAIDNKEDSIIQVNTQRTSPSSSSSNLASHSNVSSNPSSPSVSHTGVETAVESKSDNTESPTSANLRRIKRFHVTFVSSDVSSPNSD